MCSHIGHLDIVACQQGGVSNKPHRAPDSDKTRGQGSFGPFTGGLNLTLLVIATYKNFKERTDRTFDPFLPRQGEPGTSQYILSDHSQHF